MNSDAREIALRLNGKKPTTRTFLAHMLLNDERCFDPNLRYWVVVVAAWLECSFIIFPVPRNKPPLPGSTLMHDVETEARNAHSLHLSGCDPFRKFLKVWKDLQRIVAANDPCKLSAWCRTRFISLRALQAITTSVQLMTWQLSNNNHATKFAILSNSKYLPRAMVELVLKYDGEYVITYNSQRCIPVRALVDGLKHTFGTCQRHPVNADFYWLSGSRQTEQDHQAQICTSEKKLFTRNRTMNRNEIIACCTIFHETYCYLRKTLCV